MVRGSMHEERFSARTDNPRVASDRQGTAARVLERRLKFRRESEPINLCRRIHITREAWPLMIALKRRSYQKR